MSHALEKLPADRFASAAEFAAALGNTGYTLQGVTAASGAGAFLRGGAQWNPLTMGLAGVAFVALVLAVWGWSRPEARPTVARFEIGVSGSPEPATAGNGASLAFAPDGQNFVYAGSDGTLYVRDLIQLVSRPLPTRGASPFYSPDGAWVGFADQAGLRKIALGGGPPLAIAAVTDLRGATWGTDGTIVYSPSTASPLLRVGEGGGPADTITRLDPGRGVTSHRWPHYLPDQRGILFQACRGSVGSCEIAIYAPNADSIRYLMPGTTPRYVASGYIIYVSTSGALLAVPFDLGRMELTGNPVSLMEGILVRSSWNGDYTLSANGSLLYVTGEAAGVSLSVVDTSGSATALVRDLREGHAPRLSPDGRRIAVRAAPEGASEIWIYDRTLATLSRLTFEGNADYPEWSPDGDTVFYTTDAGGQDRDLWRRAADGSGQAARVLERPNPQFELAIRPAGDFALMREVTANGPDLYVLPMDPPGEPTPWVVTSFSERSPSLAPDGRWAAYSSNESGQDEIYVRAFPDPVGRWQISAGGGTEPHWSADGSTIYYRRADSLFATAVQTRPGFAVGQRRLVMAGLFQPNPSHTNYDRDSRTGQFIMMTQTQVGSSSMVLVLNWIEELRARVRR